MTIRKDEGVYWIECDACGDCDDLEAENFDDAVLEIKGAGYTFHRTAAGEWEHYHNACVVVSGKEPELDL